MPAHKQKSSIIREMKAKFDVNLADEIIAYCIRHSVDPYDEFIKPERFDDNGATVAAWSTDEAEDYIRSRIAAAPSAKRSASALLAQDPVVARDAIIGLMQRHFIITGEQGQTLYHIDDPINRIVTPVVMNKVERQVSQAVKFDVAADGIVMTDSLAHHFLDVFGSNAEPEAAPKLWAQPEDPCFCLGRALIRPDAAVPFPYFQTVLDRMNDPQAFGAWYWGIYAGVYQGRQMLYLSDIHGMSGKSSMARELERPFNMYQDAQGRLRHFTKPRITAALNWNILKDSSHASSHFAGKKFVWVGDNKNPNLLMSQAVKELSGDDMAMVNPKHLPAYSTYMEAKLMVLGNCEPNITSELHNLSRTLWIILARQRNPALGDFHRHYAAEMPGILAYFEHCYHERCRDDYEIRVNAAVTEATALKVRVFEDEFSIPFHTYFAVDAAAELKAIDLNRVMFEILKWTEHKAGHFREWLDRTYDITRVKCGPAWAYRGLRRVYGSDGDTLLHDEDQTVYGAGFSVKNGQRGAANVH